VRREERDKKAKAEVSRAATISEQGREESSGWGFGEPEIEKRGP